MIFRTRLRVGIVAFIIPAVVFSCSCSETPGDTPSSDSTSISLLVGGTTNNDTAPQYVASHKDSVLQQLQFQVNRNDDSTYVVYAFNGDSMYYANKPPNIYRSSGYVEFRDRASNIWKTIRTLHVQYIIKKQDGSILYE